MLEKNLSIEDTIRESEISEEIVRNIFQLHHNSIHKRILSDEL